MKFLAGLIAVLASTVPALATDSSSDPFSDPLIQQIVARHEKAVKGDTAETKSLTADLEKWTAQHPDNHLLQAYLGAAYTLSSRDAWPGPGKLTYLRKGGAELDAAVAADPTNPAVRFVRAIDYFELPSFFGKRSIARADFQILVKQVDGEMKSPATLNTDTQQAIYYFAGESYKQQWDEPKAKDLWQRGLKLDPTSDLGRKMAAELAKVK
jgi:tetratricopeptide (TPR) repeat protein